VFLRKSDFLKKVQNMTKSMKNYKILDEKYDFLKKGGNFPAIVHGKMGKYAQLN
jgi:hypothetical protein